MDLHELSCVGADGESRTFWYDVVEETTPGGSVWHFRVHRRNPPDYNKDDWFVLGVIEFDEGSVRVDMIENRGKEWYRAKGISEAIIIEASRVLGRRVVSSSNKVKVADNEYRTLDAEKVWRRLAAKGQAVYCSTTDRYLLQI